MQVYHYITLSALQMFIALSCESPTRRPSTNSSRFMGDRCAVQTS